MNAIFRTQVERRLKMREGRVVVTTQSVRNRQGVLDVILIGLDFVSLAQVLDRLAEVAHIQTGDSQGIMLLGRLGPRGDATGPLPAEAQMQLRALGYLSGVNINKLFKYFRSATIILFLKSSHANRKIANDGLIVHVGKNFWW